MYRALDDAASQPESRDRWNAACIASNWGLDEDEALRYIQLRREDQRRIAAFKAA